MAAKKTTEARLDKIEEIVRRWDEKLRHIVENQQHYLDARGKTRTKYHMEKVKLLRKMEVVMKMLGQKHLMAEQTNCKGVKRTALLLSQNERLKLLRLLNDDYRSAFRCAPEDADVLRELVAERRASREPQTVA